MICVNKSVWFSTESTNKNFTQTVYDVVTENDVKCGHGEFWNDKKMKVINNLICYKDDQYGFLPVVALNLDQVKLTRSGWDHLIYGSVVELHYPNGKTRKAIVLDACGQARFEKKIDLWQYKLDTKEHIENVSFEFIRKGWNNNSKFKF